MPTQLQSPEVQAFATGFPITLLHFGVTGLILFLGATLYVLLTPHREINGVIGGQLQKQAGVRSTLVILTSRMEKARAIA